MDSPNSKSLVLAFLSQFNFALACIWLIHQQSPGEFVAMVGLAKPRGVKSLVVDGFKCLNMLHNYVPMFQFLYRYLATTHESKLKTSYKQFQIS